MKFEKLLIHEVEWRHASFLIISSCEYPELGILAWGEQTHPDVEGDIKLVIPGFDKPMCLQTPCGCCESWANGVDPENIFMGNALECDTDEGVDLGEYSQKGRLLNLAFIAAVRSCCTKQGIATLIFHLFDDERTAMAQDKNGLHIISLQPTSAEIDFARYKRAFTELQIHHPGLDPEDLAEY